MAPHGCGGLHTQWLALALPSLVVMRWLPGDAPGLFSLNPTPDLHEGIKNMAIYNMSKKKDFFLSI